VKDQLQATFLEPGQATFLEPGQATFPEAGQAICPPQEAESGRRVAQASQGWAGRLVEVDSPVLSARLCWAAAVVAVVPAVVEQMQSTR
jgi:hypothetical protein